ncbi:Fatty acid amide hydrolase [Abeliophyllum distichum]|uniref:Fatty acid amide hydrolase n=1 Tax=Abeliophyllum distichum TaxID=126358 RepID=A0ABD1TGZ3_9LAMI
MTPQRIEVLIPASFRYWKIRDYAYAYRSKLTTPSILPHKGKTLSILDGIFVAVKDDIDCYPHPSKGGTTFFHEIRPVEEDATSVSRLRSCGVILVGKANMHELGLGTTGNNPNYGTARNPHDPKRYTGGSLSGPAAIVSSGLFSAALGTDGNRLWRSVCDSGTVEIIGAITSTVEDAIHVYAAILGSSIADKIALKPSLPCLPNLSSHENSSALESIRLGKYTEELCASPKKKPLQHLKR